MTDSSRQDQFIELAADIVSAYVSNNSVPASDLPGLISEVHSALKRVTTGTPVVSAEPPRPAISAKKSISDNYLICLEDGKKFKSLKRHLRTKFNLTPDQYRDKWNLGSDYPMSPPIMPRRARRSPRKWASASSAARWSDLQPDMARSPFKANSALRAWASAM